MHKADAVDCRCSIQPTTKQFSSHKSHREAEYHTSYLQAPPILVKRMFLFPPRCIKQQLRLRRLNCCRPPGCIIRVRVRTVEERNLNDICMVSVVRNWGLPRWISRVHHGVVSGGYGSIQMPTLLICVTQTTAISAPAECEMK
jgi:hypothetical protein